MINKKSHIFTEASIFFMKPTGSFNESGKTLDFVGILMALKIISPAPLKTGISTGFIE
jgi:hypothetical protein